MTDLSGKSILYWAPSAIPPSARFTPEAELYAIEALPKPEIPGVWVVRDFPDVFPEELHGMPPDRSVDFVIEVVPGTATVSRRPYRMPPEELVELKKRKPNSNPWQSGTRATVPPATAPAARPPSLPKPIFRPLPPHPVPGTSAELPQHSAAAYHPPRSTPPWRITPIPPSRDTNRRSPRQKRLPCGSSNRSARRAVPRHRDHVAPLQVGLPHKPRQAQYPLGLINRRGNRRAALAAAGRPRRALRQAPPTEAPSGDIGYPRRDAEPMESMALLQSQMTTMMQQMQGSLNRIVPTEGMTPNFPLATGNGRTFSTPPTRTNSILSPIPEDSTPIPTPHSANHPPFPPTLGQFAPDQLPLPPCIQGVRQKDTAYSGPITSTAGPSSSYTHITQHTTPTNQPQFYQPHSPRQQQHDPIPQWLVHWDTMTAEEATWEDASFIQETFPVSALRSELARGVLSGSELARPALLVIRTKINYVFLNYVRASTVMALLA
nr:uncharacterized protein LOC127319100 [Lolium perenne]